MTLEHGTKKLEMDVWNHKTGFGHYWPYQLIKTAYNVTEQTGP